MKRLLFVLLLFQFSQANAAFPILTKAEHRTAFYNTHRAPGTPPHKAWIFIGAALILVGFLLLSVARGISTQYASGVVGVYFVGLMGSASIIMGIVCLIMGLF